jgi:fido (protein-threonine AMPylation protein)
MNEFGRSAQEQREYERIRYPGSDVLRNKLDCRTQEELDEAERLIVSSRLEDSLPPAATHFDVKGLKAVHHHLFQDIYPWAGEFRRYTTGRGDAPFPPPEYIESSLERLFGELHAEKHLTGLNQPKFAARAAHFVNEVNAVHPFVEGNGRMQRVWLRNLAEHAGYSLLLTGHDRQEWYRASAHGFYKGDEPMAELITRSIRRLTD